MNFFDRVYELCKKIPRGRVSTYKIIAEKLDTKAYRLVGYALKNNSNIRKIPCYRIVDSNGRLCGFDGNNSRRSLNKKAKLLRKEGIIVKDNKIMNFEKVLYKF